jgi:hypothetical protein
MLKKDHSSVIAQLHAIQAIETPSVSQDLQALLYKHQMVFTLPKESLLPMVFMIIPFPLYLEAFLPIFVCITSPFHKTIKLRKWSKKSLMQALSTLV